MLTPESFLWKALEFYGTRVHHRGKWRLHRILREVFQIRHSQDLEVERRGLRWILNPGDFVESSFYWTGEFEDREWEHLARVLPEHGVFMDVGANFGYYALVLARASKANVHAFEPHPQVFSRLTRNITLNGMEDAVTAVPLGLSDRRESAHLESVAGNSGASFLSSRGTKITLDTLDHYCDAQGVARVDLIKIDVEGHEVNALRGATRVLEACRPALMVEFNPAALERAGSSARQLESLLRSHGYQLYLPVRRRLALFNKKPGSYFVLNVIALPEG